MILISAVSQEEEEHKKCSKSMEVVTEEQGPLH